VATQEKNIISAANDNSDSNARYRCVFVHKMCEGA
jgi:hypothetical protein